MINKSEKINNNMRQMKYIYKIRLYESLVHNLWKNGSTLEKIIHFIVHLKTHQKENI